MGGIARGAGWFRAPGKAIVLVKIGFFLWRRIVSGITAVLWGHMLSKKFATS